QIIYPFARGIYRLLPVVLAAGRIRRFAVVVAIFTTALLSSLLIPVDHSTYTEGVVSLPENAFIRAGADGIVTAVELADGDPVDRNGLILRLENMALQARLEGLVARLEETRARQQRVFLQDRTQADILGAKVSAIEADIQDVEEQMESLEVVSATAGVVSLPMASDLPGRYVNRGDVIGYVAGPGRASALVVVPQPGIDAVRRNMNSIEVRLNSRPAETLTAQFVRELPQGTDRLPNRILGSGSGGQMAVDVRDESGMQLLTNVFLVEVALPLEKPGNYLGQRIYVRFVHEGESLGSRLLRRLNQFLLQAPFV
ncbi:MAG: hypothetical protein OEN02_10575, partial [Gammaproteobacteria bacterium]|nr:hypothetical protein [Gammaproteobacteria bacterium]